MTIRERYEGFFSKGDDINWLAVWDGGCMLAFSVQCLCLCTSSSGGGLAGTGIQCCTVTVTVGFRALRSALKNYKIHIKVTHELILHFCIYFDQHSSRNWRPKSTGDNNSCSCGCNLHASLTIIEMGVFYLFWIQQGTKTS